MDYNLDLPLPNELHVVFGIHAGEHRVLDLAARLALLGPLYILDCGNRGNMHVVAKSLRTHTHDPASALNNIRLSRAFTCYQVKTLVKKVPLTSSAPVLILDLLSTFLDESVRAQESSVLFTETMNYIEALSRATPVLVTAKPFTALSAPRLGLLSELRQRANRIWEEMPMQTPLKANQQPSLFGDSFFGGKR